MWLSKFPLLGGVLFTVLCLAVGAVFAATTPSANVSWTPATTNTDGSPVTGTVTFNLYQGTQVGTATPTLTKVASALTATSDVITAGLTAGSTQCFAVTEVVNGVESAQSLQACTAIPFPTPGAPTQITVVVH